MLTFLFWNMGGLPSRASLSEVTDRNHRLARILGNLTRVHGVDLLMVAECPVATESVLVAVNHNTESAFRRPDVLSNCQRVLLFPRFDSQCLKVLREDVSFTCRVVRLPDRETILLMVVHFRSKLHQGVGSQASDLQAFSAELRSCEAQAKQDRTVLVGDFNMSPFESGFVTAPGLNAVMTRGIAGRGMRKHQGRMHPFFYNPMWGHFGDAAEDNHRPQSPQHKPAGTCFYAPRESEWFYWYMFDQVLVRPALLPFFRNEDLKILTNDGETEFLNTRGIPKRKAIADHLPILFRLHV